jgi:hypothetical protein
VGKDMLGDSVKTFAESFPKNVVSIPMQIFNSEIKELDSVISFIIK